MKTAAQKHASGPSQERTARTSPSEVATKRRSWSTAFLIAGSAILGATAVAFWNRRTIANMRLQFLDESEHPRPPVHTEEEIF